ncbi:dihydroorotate dehydrogenase electron transfer subunit [Tichowtungia aerotolerans]|uniref:Dihydroorotate dehydrogenase electron transfer subunit n=1 Tax=Tichowtungia aerotolerans TaxID=2697043 RepID=A0A6P1M6W6_9BACT|nr:dihydroorotate dehydrogenase electron transfer subunit [Tichowtungia aerotolerans]QHI69597.1 dihydroorotate dehydrogenase electron transfer subunit [Tichowtungia aerotolerans]
MIQEKTVVIQHDLFQGQYRLLRVAAPKIGPNVQPGQFIHLKIPRMEHAVLRRPFSVFKADDEGLSILYATIGKGTAALNSVQPGEELDLLGPLGNGFPTLGKDKTIPVLVAGGYGNAALYLQAAGLPAQGVAFFGGRTAEDILCVDEFKALGWDVRVATDDGSMGTKGLVTAALDPWLEEQKEQFQALEIFACGPNAMLRAIGDRALEKQITAWLSMDRNMACGVGACLTCVIKRKTETGWEWARCCKDGPVFNAKEILWDE